MNNLKIVIINFTGNRKNWGCQATSWELYKFFSNLLPNLNKIEVVPFLDPDPINQNLFRKYGDKARRALSSSNPCKSDLEAAYTIVKERYGENINKVTESDLVIFQAEGSITGSSFLGGEFLLLLPFLAKVLWGKKVISINQTLFSASKNFKKILYNVLKNLDLLAVRESASLVYAKKLGLKNVLLIPDFAFCTQIDENLKIKNNKQICLTGSAIIRRTNPDIFISTVDDICNKYSLDPIFLCSTKEDIEFYKTNFPYFSAKQIPIDTTYEEVAKIIAESGFLLGGRYHLSILAAISSTPFIQLESNTFKSEGLLSLLNLKTTVPSFENRELILKEFEIYHSSMKSVSSNLEISVSILKNRIELARLFFIELLKNYTNFHKEKDKLLKIYSPYRVLLKSSGSPLKISRKKIKHYENVNY